MGTVLMRARRTHSHDRPLTISVTAFSHGVCNHGVCNTTYR